MLSAWVALTLLGGASGERREDLVEILTQASFAEQLARFLKVDTGTAYTAGMIYGVARALRVPLEAVAEPSLVGDHLSEGVLHGRGPVGDLIHVLQAFADEQPDVGRTIGLSPLEVSQYYLTAWAWAQRTLSNMTV